MVAVLALGTQACTLRPLSQQATRRVDSVALSGDSGITPALLMITSTGP